MGPGTIDLRGTPYVRNSLRENEAENHLLPFLDALLSSSRIRYMNTWRSLSTATIEVECSQRSGEAGLFLSISYFGSCQNISASLFEQDSRALCGIT